MLKSSFYVALRNQSKYLDNLNKKHVQNNLQTQHSPLYKNSYQQLSFGNKAKTFDADKINSLGITNMHIIGENGVRGESLSKKNKYSFYTFSKGLRH